MHKCKCNVGVTFRTRFGAWASFFSNQSFILPSLRVRIWLGSYLVLRWTAKEDSLLGWRSGTRMRRSWAMRPGLEVESMVCNLRLKHKTIHDLARNIIHNCLIKRIVAVDQTKQIKSGVTFWISNYIDLLSLFLWHGNNRDMGLESQYDYAPWIKYSK